MNRYGYCKVLPIVQLRVQISVQYTYQVEKQIVIGCYIGRKSQVSTVEALIRAMVQRTCERSHPPLVADWEFENNFYQVRKILKGSKIIISLFLPLHFSLSLFLFFLSLFLSVSLSFISIFFSFSSCLSLYLNAFSFLCLYFCFLMNLFFFRDAL